MTAGVSEERDMTPVVSSARTAYVMGAQEPLGDALRTRLLWITWMNILLTVLFLGVLNTAKGAKLVEAFCRRNVAEGRPFRVHLLGPVGDFPWRELDVH